MQYVLVTCTGVCGHKNASKHSMAVNKLRELSTGTVWKAYGCESNPASCNEHLGGGGLGGGGLHAATNRVRVQTARHVQHLQDMPTKQHCGLDA